MVRKNKSRSSTIWAGETSNTHNNIGREMHGENQLGRTKREVSQFLRMRGRHYIRVVSSGSGSSCVEFSGSPD
jgi:hypothetical protein